jgi:hypothetical protein
MGVFPKRFARFGLRIHPTKTTLIVSRKPKVRQASAQGNGTCAFLGFTHSWAGTRRGQLAVFALLTLGMLESLANGLLSVTDRAVTHSPPASESASQ